MMEYLERNWRKRWEMVEAASITTLVPCFVCTGEMAFDDIQRGNADRLTVAYGRLPINLGHDREVGR